MINIVLTGWFLISTYGVDETHNYLLEDRKNNMYISITLDKPLPNELDTWERFYIEADCVDIATTHEIPGDRLSNVNSKFCNANKVKVMPCTRGAYLNGRIYC